MKVSGIPRAPDLTKYHDLRLNLYLSTGRRLEGVRMADRNMQIGAVAREAGVNIQTLRYYERRGLLQPPERTPGGFRLYPSGTVRVIRFIKRAQELGFSLDETEELLRLKDDRTSTCAEVRAAARAKVEEVDRKIQSLQAMKKALDVLVNSCRGNGSTRACPILESLDDAPRAKG